MEGKPASRIQTLGYELSQEVDIKFEEGLYAQAIAFLKELLVAGRASRNGIIRIPSVDHISLIATLAVHPNFTNRAKDQAARNVSIAAFDLLHILDRIVDPIQACYTEAFIFPDLVKADHRSRRRLREAVDEEALNIEELVQEKKSIYATDRAIWRPELSFWDVVGFAFRSSLAYPTRWNAAWLPWLTYIVDILQRDRDARKDLGSNEDSLIALYVLRQKQRGKREPREHSKNILAAIFADAADRPGRKFEWIFKNETKPRPSELKKEPVKQNINVEEDLLGDYKDVSEGEDDVDSESEQTQLDDFKQTDAAAEIMAVWGGDEAAMLRMRLLSLVTETASHPQSAIGSVRDFCHLILDDVRPLPLGAFLFFFAPRIANRCFSEEIATFLLRRMIGSIIQSGAKVSDDVPLNQSTLIERYLPFTAKTKVIVENAKMSISVECLLQRLFEQDKLVWTDELHRAAETGIEARKARAIKAKGVKGEEWGSGGLEADERDLESSAYRMRTILQLLKMRVK